MSPDRFTEKFIFAIGGRFPARQQLLDQASDSTLERGTRLQVMHHAQRHGFITLLREVERQTAGLQYEGRVEHRRQGDAIPAIAHRPAIVIVQMVGIPQNRRRLPLQPLQRLKNSGVGTDVVRVRVD